MIRPTRHPNGRAFARTAGLAGGLEESDRTSARLDEFGRIPAAVFEIGEQLFVGMLAA